MLKTSIKERNKAIRLAWEREQKLVAEGKGTRDWSQDQQKDILDPDKGKAYDENGRAFEGQHMKSVSEFPEYQGNPDNIQFLTREEHLEAHKGSWQNPTNWYYNPETKELVDFGDNRAISCSAISLSEPICSPVVESKSKVGKLKETTTGEKADIERTKPSRQEDTSHHSGSKTQTKTTVAPPEVHENFGDKILHVVEAAKGLSEKHPILTEIVKWGGAAAVVAATVAVANNSSGGGRSSGNGGSDYSSPDSYDDCSSQADDNDDDYGGSSVSRDFPDEHSSLREHDVSGYDRQQNGKTVHVNPYRRGGKHDEE